MIEFKIKPVYAKSIVMIPKYGWQQIGTLTLERAIEDLFKNEYKIQGKIYREDTLEFRTAFEHERMWEKLKK